MADDRLEETLRAMQPPVPAAATEDALHSVHAASSARRRRQRRLVAAVGAAAALVLIAGAVAVMIDDDPGETVVVDQPTTTPSSSATTTTTSTTSTSADPASSQVGTIDDLALGVTGLELRTWWTDGEDPEFWNGFWRADPGLTEAVAAAMVASPAGVVRPDETDVVTMRFKLADGRFVFVDVDIESGWVEPDRQLPADLTRVLRTGFNDAVGRPWEEVDLDQPGSPITAALDRISFPIADLAEVAGTFQEAFEASLDAEYERWFVEVIDDGQGPIVEVRARGMGDDSSNGTDYRISLVETPGGWEVGTSQLRALCMRSIPGPAPMYGCL